MSADKRITHSDPRFFDECVSTERFFEMQEAVELLNGMTDEERLAVVGLYCAHCGCQQEPLRPCQCWNDE